MSDYKMISVEELERESDAEKRHAITLRHIEELQDMRKLVGDSVPGLSKVLESLSIELNSHEQRLFDMERRLNKLCGLLSSHFKKSMEGQVPLVRMLEEV